MTKILVLGSTGNIGWPLVQQLATIPTIDVIAGIHHHPNPDLQALGVQTVPFDFLDPATFEPALNAVDKLFFVRPPQLANPEHDMQPFLQAAKAHHIKQVVFISLIGVEKNPMVPHRKIERMITNLALPYTFLRPGFFMQNLITSHGEDLRQRHTLFIPAGHAKTSFIDCRDIAAAAAVVLQDPQYLGQALELTGPVALTYQQVANMMTAILGTPISYAKPSFLRFRRVMLKRGIPKEFVNVMVMLYLITRLGHANHITNTLPQVIGRSAHTMQDFITDEVKPYFEATEKN